MGNQRGWWHHTLLLALILAAVASPVQAGQGLDGAQLSPLWALPFVAVLASIALGPLLAAHIWHRHYGKIVALWSLALLVPLTLRQGVADTAQLLVHLLLVEYLPFILLLGTLFTIAGGIHVRGTLRGVPWVNTGLLAFGSVLASIIGTTGASMVLIQPLIRANAARNHNAHVMIFFIFLVSNIGGALTPLGDPPLFLGFLRGVGFFWTLEHLWAPTLLCVTILLGVFFVLDFALWRRDTQAHRAQKPEPVRVEGLINLALIGLVILVVILGGIWQPGFSLEFLGTKLPLQNLLRDLALIALGFASIVLTPRALRAANGFEWEPILEVAKLFAGIFICITPVLAMLSAGPAGAFAPLLAGVSHPDGSPDNGAFFWATGLLSSFLDNAPTYLVFFELAGGDVARLTGPLAGTLAAISLGAVFMGANSYIGNAPNFMVYAIARRSGIKMPGFFGYMLWSGTILIPLFGLVTWVFLR